MLNQKNECEVEFIFPQRAMTAEEEKELSAYFLQKKVESTKTTPVENTVLEKK